MKPQIERLFALYQALPRIESQAKTLIELAKLENVIQAYELQGEPSDSQRRQMQRDLDSLSDALKQALKSEIDKKPKKYYLPASANMDKTDSSTAMLLLLAESFLKKVAPKDLLENAKWLFDGANNQLEANKKVKNWRKRIYFKPLQDEFKGIKPEDELTIYQALQQDEPFKIIYHSQQHDEEREYRAYPVKIVIEPHCRLLILENPTHKDTITFLFHRIKHAEIIKNFNDFPDRVNLNLDKIEQELPKHTESMFSRQQLDLTLQVAQHERYIIEDAPVFANYEKSQVSIEDDEVEFSISKVFVSYSVLNYLIAHADLIYVAEPEELRDRVVEQLESGLNRYGYFEEMEDE